MKIHHPPQRAFAISLALVGILNLPSSLHAADADPIANHGSGSATLSVGAIVEYSIASPIVIHGSVSATEAYSDKYNFLGHNDGKFDLIQREMTLNGAYRFENGLRTSAQLYAYDFQGYRDLTIDFANVDYSVVPEFGVRAGRNKVMHGFYNDVQDLDQVRVFASLPLAFYPRAFRALRSGSDGLSFYGSVSTPKAGSFDYTLSAGYAPSIGRDAPFARSLAGMTRVQSMKGNWLYGASLVWNTPVDGLRVGYSFSFLPEIKMEQTIDTRAGLAARAIDAPPAVMVDAMMGPGAWDNSGLFAGTSAWSSNRLKGHVFSAEYTIGEWIATVEYSHADQLLEMSMPALGPNMSLKVYQDDVYGQLTYQVTKRIGLGVYYAFSDSDPKNTDPRPSKYTTMKDAAAAVSYAVTPWWLVKAEVHAIDGLMLVGRAGEINRTIDDPRFTVFMLKTTLSF